MDTRSRKSGGLVMLLLLFFAPVFSLSGQEAIQGRVVNPAGEALAFVTVLIDGQPGKGVLSDIEGRFYVGADAQARFLVFRYVGYPPLRLEKETWVNSKNHHLEVVLQPADEQLPEAVIRAGENPADRLVRHAIAHRDQNNPEKRNGYQCKTYNKIVFEALPHRTAFERLIAGRDTSRRRWRNLHQQFHLSEKQAAVQHLFLMESVTERTFRFPGLVQERVLLNRVSGLEGTGMTALANLVQPFSCYGDFLRILDKNYVNPISPGSPKLYFFNIEDTLYRAHDTLYILSFHPRKGRVFDGLQGVLHLSTHQWAVQAIRAVPADRHAVMQVRIEQSYALVREHWFPAQLNFELELEQYPSPMMGLRAAGRSYVQDAVPDAPTALRDFDPEMPLVFLPSAERPRDTAWQRWHLLAPLTAREERTYTFLDSVAKKRNFKRLSQTADALTTGFYPIRPPLVFDLSKLLRINDFEGVRIGAGLSTAQYRPLRSTRRVETGVWGGYGVRDHRWKYGGYGLWRIVRSYQTQLRAGASRDLLEPGALHELQPAAFVNRALYARRMDRATQYVATLTARPFAPLLLQAAVRRQQLKTDLYGYAYRTGENIPTDLQHFTFKEATAYLRFARGERTRQVLGQQTQAIHPWPVVELGYTRGWGRFSYHRWAAALYQSVPIRRLGIAEWRIEAGRVTPGVPLSKLFLLNQGGGSYGSFAINNTFQSLPDTLFLSDRFVNLYCAQEIGHILYRSKYSSPFLTLVQNAAWGDLNQAARHTGLGFVVARRPYLESGFRLDHLIQFKYARIGRIGAGVALFYRWGFLQRDDFRKNITPRLSLRFTLQ